MKNIFLVISFIFVSVQIVFPQDSQFYDAPFGGGGGYVGGWIVPKLDGINAQLKNFGVPALPTSGFYTSGGAGFIYLGFIKNLRIGGMGFSGSRSTASATVKNYAGAGSPVPNYVTEFREAILSLSGGGFTIDYTFPFVKDFGISLGAVIGRGSLNIQLYKNLGNADWQYFWDTSVNPNGFTQSSSLKNSYWIFTPTLNVDIPAYHLLSFRIGAGYQYTFGSSWTYDNNKDILNAPSDINGNSFFVQAGIFVGLFSY
ncbi:MAG: hypothetical protein ACYCVH_16560 [Ignavibacteriaceae bacterium]